MTPRGYAVFCSRCLALFVAFCASGLAGERRLDLISHAPDGSAGHGETDMGNISGNGRYVIFGSRATDLVAGGNGDKLDGIYVADRVSGDISRLNIGTADEVVASPRMYISDDGRWVLFLGTSGVTTSDPSPGPAGGVYLHDRNLGSTRLLSKKPDPTVPVIKELSMETQPMSADGRFAVFSSYGDLMSNGEFDDPNYTASIYLYDRDAGNLRRIAFGGGESISGDGRYVAFVSPDPANRNPTQRPAVWAWRYDRVTGRIEPIPSALGGYGTWTSMSFDGRFVYDGGREIVDMVTGTSSRCPEVPYGYVTLDYAGQHAALWSREALAPSDHNAGFDYYLWDRATDSALQITDRFADNETVYSTHMAGDGKSVLLSTAKALVANDDNNDGDIYVYTYSEPVFPAGGSPSPPPTGGGTGTGSASTPTGSSNGSGGGSSGCGAGAAGVIAAGLSAYALIRAQERRESVEDM